MKYDFLIVGSGLYGAVCANELKKKGFRCLVVEKREHIGGNIYTKEVSGINVHCYGAHIFHTDNLEIWDYINKFSKFNNYINSPLAIYKEELYNLPFNMNTFNKLWGVKTPKEAKEIIFKQVANSSIKEITNLEQQAISLVGTDIYEKLIKGYTEKQWGKPATELPPFIIKRIPIRYNYNNNYFNDKYQGIPIGGYTRIIKKMLENIDILTKTDFLTKKCSLMKEAENIIYTGMIDQYYDYCFGELEYRSLFFETEVSDSDNFQGNAVINYTDFDIPYTRIIEHKHFENVNSDNTVITKEYPQKWEIGYDPYYPINDIINNDIYDKYLEKARREKNIYFGGRLGKYRYFDMDDTIIDALNLVRNF